MSRQRRTWEILEVAKNDDTASRVFDIFILTLILLNVLAVILGTVQSVHACFGGLLNAFEIFSVTVFTVEYVLRLWSCVVDPAYAHPVTGRIRFALTPLAIVDLLAIAPLFITVLGLDLRFVRAVRLLRIVRVSKLSRYVAALGLLGRVLRSRREELIITSALMGILLVIASSFMYIVENPAQPEQFSSIPATMWWAVATLTTVGYGDVYPITPLGKLLASVVSILGIGLFALPAGILGSGFVQEINSRNGPRRCPHCGKETDP
jgi:voltage-gated potassium channel